MTPPAAPPGKLATLLRSTVLRQILFGFGLVAAILGVGMAVTNRQLAALSGHFRDLHERDVALVDDVETLMRLVAQLPGDKRGYLLTGDTEFLDRYDAALGALRSTLRRVRAEARSRPGVGGHIDRFEGLVNRYAEASADHIALRRQTAPGGAPITSVIDAANLPRARPFIEEAEGEVRAVHDEVIRSFEAQRRRLEVESVRSRRLVVACMVLALVVAVLYGAFVTRDIAAALASLRRSIEAAARHEPPLPPLGRPDEFGAVSRSFHEMALQLARAEDALRERVRAQEATLVELRQTNEALGRAMRVKSDFLATMSHELRTPLNAVIGLSGLLLDSPSEQLSPRARQALETMRGSGEHLLTLLNDILDLAKVDAGKMTFHDAPIDVAPMARSCMATVIPLLGDKPVEVDLETPDGRLEAVGDARRVRQVLLNLLSNAAKFTDRGSVRVRVERAGNHVAVRVIDTGIGVAPDQVGRLFEEFHQVASGDARPYGGTGLGLALSRRMARAMGGDITVESEAGQGSTFTLLLRAAGVKVTEHVEEAARAAT